MAAWFWGVLFRRFDISVDCVDLGVINTMTPQRAVWASVLYVCPSNEKGARASHKKDVFLVDPNWFRVIGDERTEKLGNAVDQKIASRFWPRDMQR